MSKPKIKIKRTFDYKKLARQLPQVIADGLNEKAKWINLVIQDGINTGKDLDGKTFKKLSPVTLARRKKKMTGKTPLYETGKMSQTRIKRAKPSDLTATIFTKSKYGIYHNEGNPSMKLPKRKWFGVNKDNKPGGKYNLKSSKVIATKLHRAWRKKGI